MTQKYRYGHKIDRGRKKRAAFIIISTVLAMSGILAFVFRDLSNNKVTEVAGTTRTVEQILDEDQTLHIDEKHFSMELPRDWKEIDRRSNSQETSVTWQSTRENQDNRWLKVYIDKIPKEFPVNRLLPVSAFNNKINYGQLSENCSTFTEGGTQNTSEASQKTPAPAKWQGVDFICDLANFVDNRVGTSSKDGLNTVKVTGTRGETHKYMFVYTDRNVQPNYSIFYNAISSFRAR